MITHLVMFKFKDPTDAKTAKDLLDALPPKIPLIRSFEVGINVVDVPGRSWDLGIVSRFDSVEDLQAYQAHPDHLEATTFIKAAAESSASVDYES